MAYVFIKMANSPRPGIWVLERSQDDGQTWEPWQYFADTPSDCVNYFGQDSLKGVIADDSVICETKFSKVVPLEGGEVSFKHPIYTPEFVLFHNYVNQLVINLYRLSSLF